MSDVITAAVAALNDKLDGEGIDGTAKFVIEGEGDIIVDGNGARPADADEEAEVTLTAAPDTFQDILSGDLNPTSAFMTGKLSVDGDMGKAMQLASALS
ncbi:sterol carrier family protein [Pseudooceanicola sediminis]|uniref:Sterol carrier family protein n=1 Tax=Pseudooceanicola sediminis TaxID=2211117 RepID=A0A399IYL1_9RHOB|nr:SCP2 sterol-binding domain-containing protein [Pseudooceanicola sediminis]KAA2312070.1 SCP2 sterol-binding domain-containing protein [Puniceibacterium sp. HSS470]RII38080.1 sterol carrier family protein [Pseudooceanicola sediminis]|tara:strand:- start:6692 stop:6988 length:297 start_codon:yes stop_codon:yes gene_type:complete